MTRAAGLDALRGTLLAACGLSVSACAPTSPPPEPSPTTSEPPAFVEAVGDPTTSPPPMSCPGGSPIIRGDNTGYIECGDGAINRSLALACPNSINAPACEGTESRLMCKTNADCTDGDHGFCMSGYGQIGSYCGCIYPCLSDAECGTGQACMCPDVVENGPDAASCAPAECKVDSDCPSGECGASYHFNGCYHQLSLSCRGTDDACRSDSECRDGGNCVALFEGETPEPDPFGCEHYSCVVGRPLTVDAGVRIASVAPRAWGRTRIDSLARAPERAAHWRTIASMEHASVASFARFVHELLGFGAPPQLLADALAAAADEVRHAEQTFALASAYAGAPLGPGALRVDDLGPSSDPAQFVTRLIVEGCVGETLGVAEVLALLELELDPQLRPRLEQIAADETRHAALAWRTLQWFAPRVDPAIIERAFEQAIAAVTRPDHAHEPCDPAHGRLGTAAKRRAHAQAIASVVEPCRRALA